LKIVTLFLYFVISICLEKNTDTTRRLFFEKIRKNRRKNNRSPWQPFDDDDGDDEDEDEDDDDDR